MKKTANGRKSWKVGHYEHSKEFDIKHRVAVVEVKEESDGRMFNMGMAMAGQSMLSLTTEYGGYLPLYGRKAARHAGCE